MDDQILDEQTRAALPEDLPNPQLAPKNFFTNKVVIFSSLVALAAISIIVWYFLSGTDITPNDPTSESVVLVIKGPDTLTSGNEAEFHVVYRNGENADLIAVSLELLYPSGFTFKSSTPVATSSSGRVFNLPIVKQGEGSEIIIRGKLSGSTSEDKEVKAILHYKFSNFNSQFSINESFHTTILPPNLTMDISGPVDVVNGQDMVFTVSFTNVSAQDFENLAVTLSYPAGFSFTSGTPPPSKNSNYWKIDKLRSNDSFNIDVTASFTGDAGLEKLVTANLAQIINNVSAPQMTATATFKVIPSSLILTMTSNRKDTVNLGETINYNLEYLNQGRIGLNNLVIVVNLSGPSLDLTRISAQNAIINGQTITWKAATLSNLTILSPNEKGQVSFIIPVKGNLSTNLKNQTIKATASIASDEISKATKANDVELKLASKFDLSVTGEYVSGAVPMQVGKSTTFAITFLVTNLSNDLSGAQVEASLPLPASAWNNIVVPDAEKSRLKFNPSSGKIIWNIGDLAAFVGKFTPALKVTFQLVVAPSEADRSREVNLLINVQAAGTDTFINQILLTDKIQTVSTRSIDDDVLNTKGTTVQ